jgi:hypothetical protein
LDELSAVFFASAPGFAADSLADFFPLSAEALSLLSENAGAASKTPADNRTLSVNTFARIIARHPMKTARSPSYFFTFAPALPSNYYYRLVVSFRAIKQFLYAGIPGWLRPLVVAFLEDFFLCLKLWQLRMSK